MEPTPDPTDEDEDSEEEEEEDDDMFGGGGKGADDPAAQAASQLLLKTFYLSLFYINCRSKGIGRKTDERCNGNGAGKMQHLLMSF